MPGPCEANRYIRTKLIPPLHHALHTELLIKLIRVFQTMFREELTHLVWFMNTSQQQPPALLALAPPPQSLSLPYRHLLILLLKHFTHYFPSYISYLFIHSFIYLLIYFPINLFLCLIVVAVVLVDNKQQYCHNDNNNNSSNRAGEREPSAISEKSLRQTHLIPVIPSTDPPNPNKLSLPNSPSIPPPRPDPYTATPA